MTIRVIENLLALFRKEEQKIGSNFNIVQQQGNNVMCIADDIY